MASSHARVPVMVGLDLEGNLERNLEGDLEGLKLPEDSSSEVNARRESLPFPKMTPDTGV